MKYIKLIKQLPDNRVLEYHRIQECIFEEQPTSFIAVIGSWSTLTGLISGQLPEARFSIPMPINPTTGFVQDTLLEEILTVQGWTTGIILNSDNIL